MPIGPSLAPRARLGRYEIVGPLGAGGMGEVYRARDTTLNRDVAIKILPSVFAHDQDRLTRFVREAQTLAALNHPSIATIYGVEESAGGVHALVMELVEGDDLSVHIARGPMSMNEALPIAKQIAEALEAAHEQGIIHRDLKPANIKVRPDGAVKVLDFGLAKALSADSSGTALENSPTITSPAMTERGVILGTAAYMSPEQAKGRPVDKRADIWAFGIVLYEMLTGERPFQRDSVTETLAAVLTHEPDLSGWARGVPPVVTTLLRRCLERDPKKRLRDIGEARLILGDTNPVDRPAVAEADAPRRPARWLQIAAAAAVACALGFAAAWFIVRGRVAALPGSVRSEMTTTPITTSGNVISAAISPDGRYVAYVESEQGRQSLWLQQVAGGQTLRLIPEQNVSYWNQTFTPDGNHIVFGLITPDDVPGGLYSISTLGGAPKLLLKKMDSVVTYSPDGTRMAFLRNREPTSGQSSLMVAGADGSNPKTLVTVKFPERIAGIFFGGACWSPDGKVIVTAVNRTATGADNSGRLGEGDAQRGRLIQVSVETGAVTTLSDPGWVTAAQCGWRPDGKSLLVIAQAPDQIGTQIWSVSHPSGEARRVTSSLNDYRSISLSGDGHALVSVAGGLSLNVLTLPLKGSSRPVRVSRSTVDGQNGVAFMSENKIVYASASDGLSRLWRASADGADRVPMVTASAGEFLRYPVVSDAGSIYHVAVNRSRLEIRVALPDGSSRVLATDAAPEQIGASADGKVVVYVAMKDGASRLVRIGGDGSGRKQITDVNSFGPSVDPSGQRVAFFYLNAQSQFRIGVAPVDGGPLLADLPIEPPTGNARLVLRAEGVYVNNVPGDRANVWLLPLDGRPGTRVTSFDDQVLFDFAVSRDGASLALVRGSRLRDAQLIRGFEASAPVETR